MVPIGIIVFNAYKISMFYKKIVKNIGIKEERLFAILVTTSGFIYLFITPSSFDVQVIMIMLYTALGLFLIEALANSSIKKHLQNKKDIERMKEKRKTNTNKSNKKVVLINQNRDDLKKLPNKEWAEKISKELIENLKKQIKIIKNKFCVAKSVFF